MIETDFMKLYEELSEINSNSTPIEAMDKVIQEYFGQDKPGDGCILLLKWKIYKYLSRT